MSSAILKFISLTQNGIIEAQLTTLIFILVFVRSVHFSTEGCISLTGQHLEYFENKNIIEKGTQYF